MIAFVRVVLVSISVAILVNGCLGEGFPQGRAQEFSEQIPEGMPRDEAVDILSEDAWYHEICTDHPFNAEIFFYDNREWSRSEIVIMFTEMVNEEYFVEGIYGAEPNEWHTWYEGCYDRSMFTGQEDSPLATP